MDGVNTSEKNLKYPLDAKRYGYQGNVYMSFVVLSDGSITSAKIIGSPHEVLSAEALRMLEISPNWIPATVKWRPCRLSIVYPKSRFSTEVVYFKISFASGNRRN